MQSSSQIITINIPTLSFNRQDHHQYNTQPSQQRRSTESVDVGTKEYNKPCGRPPQYATICKLTFDLLTLKAVSESRVSWTTSVPILVFLGLSVLDLRQTKVRRASSLNAPYLGGGGIINVKDL